jgi:trimeric autotransporter adhesin
LGFGDYKGISGLATGIGYAVSDRVRLNASFSGSPDTNDYGFGVGGSFTLN